MKNEVPPYFIGIKTLDSLGIDYELPCDINYNLPFNLYEFPYGMDGMLTFAFSNTDSIYLSNTVTSPFCSKEFIIWHEYLHMTLPIPIAFPYKVFDCFPTMGINMVNADSYNDSCKGLMELCVLVMSGYMDDINDHIANVQQSYNIDKVNEKVFKFVRDFYIS